MKFSAFATMMFASFALVSTPSFAREERTATDGRAPEIFTRLVDCRAITEDPARLACYDRQVGALAEAQQKRDVVIVDREQVRNTRRSLFGLTLPRLDIFGRGDEADREEQEFEQIETTIRSASQRNGHWTMVLEDGARWYQTDTRVLGKEPGPGVAIRIRRAAMGSFMANVAGQTAIRVSRTN